METFNANVELGVRLTQRKRTKLQAQLTRKNKNQQAIVLAWPELTAVAGCTQEEIERILDVHQYASGSTHSRFSLTCTRGSTGFARRAADACVGAGVTMVGCCEGAGARTHDNN